MNDDWSQCPICLEDYSSLHRPTTFICGHSTCIDHTLGRNYLRECPICRHPLNGKQKYSVSYNLEEACRFYHMAKRSFNVSTTQSSIADTQTKDRPTAASKEIYLHAEEILPRPKTTLGFIKASVATLKKVNETVKKHTKNDHYCSLHNTPEPYSCSNQRSHFKDNQLDNFY